MRWSKLRIHSGILEDLQGRAPWYKDDWKQGFNCGYRYSSTMQLHQLAPVFVIVWSVAYVSLSANLLPEPLVWCPDVGRGQVAAHKYPHVNELLICVSVCVSCKLVALLYSLKASLLSIVTPISNCRILAPSTYILFTSAIPGIAFGEQFVRYTGRKEGLSSRLACALLKTCLLLNNVSCRWTSFSCTSAYCDGHLWRRPGNALFAFTLLHSSYKPPLFKCMPALFLPPYISMQSIHNQAMPLFQ